MKAQPSLFTFVQRKGRRKEMDEDVWDPLEEVELEDSLEEG